MKDRIDVCVLENFFFFVQHFRDRMLYRYKLEQMFLLPFHYADELLCIMGVG